MKRRYFLLALTALFLTGCADSANKTSAFGADADDITIASRVKAALLQDIYVGGLGIEVQSHGGRVQLDGFVPDKDQRRHAEAIARGVRGVKSVENNIRVREKREELPF
ncbi:BON domain-containing protein [Methylocaldum szegediense]|jgi:osmotically-inducible protein OsmY|uniref:Hyperosmotically inducible periplasmic protein n=1 Tax=Methylocaldum szegediense TaxID=73780 RepID=A0ABM9I8M9_9GAMM|nr:BON domain-containing protein [Methylocaldum szegediense]CAI8960146.1 hyperosmotically inducible periplasmic protein [Methylocaldum szegediense]